MRTEGLLPALAIGLAVPAVAVQGPVWEENSTGDAGSTTGDAQTTSGTGQLGKIRGETGSTAGPTPDLEDVYLVRICDPEAFFASTDPADGGIANFDTRLWLFDDTGKGVVANDNRPGPPTVFSLVNSDPTDGSLPLSTPGLYYIAIAGSPSNALSAPGPAGVIFMLGSPTEVSGPDGPGGGAPLGGWDTFGPFPSFGMYEIRLNGVTFGDTPSIDCNDNGIVDACDILLGNSLDENGNNVPDECEQGQDGDVDGDGDVDFDDLISLLSSWGPCPPPCPADLNGDGIVDFDDLLILLASWS